jgi:hypothetical protein
MLPIQQMHRMIYHRVELQNLMSVLQHVPRVPGNNTNDDTVNSLSLSGQWGLSTIPGVNNQVQERGNESTSPTTLTIMNQPRKRAKKQCILCKKPKCTGGYNRSKCQTYDHAKTRACALCKQQGCPGHSNREKCKGRQAG